jgi:glyoxylase-like metal-dependent hydrolase (beta-lactamase superfamily II)
VKSEDRKDGANKNIVRSVRRPFTELPDTTKVYPGHGEFPNIGSEKQKNKEVTVDEVGIKN